MAYFKELIMANLCENILDLSGNRIKLINLVESIIAQDGFFNIVVEMPEELLKCSDDPQENARRIALYHHTGWYEWRLSNWGTKCDLRADDIYDIKRSLEDLKYSEEEHETISICFNTAWNPPISFYAALEKIGFSVDAIYHEPGCRVYGYYDDGFNEVKNYTNISEIPNDLIEKFGIDLTVDDEELE